MNECWLSIVRSYKRDAPQVAVFDTAFHQTMPAHAYHYALPYEFYEELGAYFFALGKVDALVFTAGIGEHDPLIREKCCAGLEPFGVLLDREKNQTGRGKAREVSKSDSPVKILVIPTNEELEIARQTVEVLNL